MKVLVTGGAGYIGSTVVTALELAGHLPVVLDTLDSGPRQFVAGRAFYQGDVADRALVTRIVTEHPEISHTLHLAARTVVPESVADPRAYYRENVIGTLELVDQLCVLGRPNIVFSSSAAVYGAPAVPEVTEDAPLEPQSPYARTKMIAELALTDLADAGDLRALMLRYFNPVGADPTLRTGVYLGEPTHVLGQLLRVVRNEQQEFLLTGTDLPTRDGTGIRDYVHVWDIARAHVAAVERFDQTLDRAGRSSVAINLGTGRGTTVRELIAVVESVTETSVPVREVAARDGDTAGGWANVDRARELLGWEAVHDLADAVRSALAWSQRRPAVLG